ncbi:MAG: hypothetical protein OEW87_08100 [Flavobacteriaceae bacterium]|nr:hypothetical protein [Flavobacteriaceae bacterium]
MMATGQSLKNVNVTLLLLTVIFTSCSKIQITSPSSQYLSPEAQGKLGSGSIRLEQSAGAEGTLDFTGDRLDNPMVMRNNVTPLSAAADIGILEKLDIVFKSNGNAPSTTVLKYQILGDDRLKAKKDNLSLSVAIGYGEEESSELESDLFNGSIDASITQQLLEASIIIGKRTSDDSLLYSSLQAFKQDARFKLNAPTNLNLHQKTFRLNTWVYGLSFGAIRYFTSAYVNLELSAQTTDWNHNDPTTFGFATLAIGTKWD